jgi:hypothetical protein
LQLTSSIDGARSKDRRARLGKQIPVAAVQIAALSLAMRPLLDINKK